MPIKNQNRKLAGLSPNQTKTMNQLTDNRSRIQSIDILRGLVMVIMALDHVRDFFLKADLQSGGDAAMNPTNLDSTTPVLFFTRWITHFCAPLFVFLAGTSVFIMGQKKSKTELSGFLIKRGIWLVLVELLIITLGWTFDPLYHLLILQVIWAIGISMIIMGLIIYLPKQIIFILGLLIVFGHNLLDNPDISKGLKGSLFSDLVYFSNFSSYEIFKGHSFMIVYAFLPWTGVMMLGYAFGQFYKQGFDPGKRKKILLILGGGLILFFIVVRLSNFYGDPVEWSSHPRGAVFGFLSFLNLNKYPPSVLFLCMTIGPGILFLALMENIQNRFTAVMNIYGRVPMFYYILHFFIIHTLVVIVFFLNGHTVSEIVPEGLPFYFRPNSFGFPLWGVYLVWISIVAVLYPLCKKYDRYKTAHIKEKWWLSYL